MIDVYAIGATLKLNDLVTPQLLKLSEQFERVDVLAAGVTRQLKAMGTEVAGIKGLIVASAKLDAGLKGVGDQAIVAEKRLRGINGAIPTAGIGLERELNRANLEADLLEKKLLGMRALGRVPGGGGNGVPPLIPGAGGSGGRHGGGRIHGGNLHMGNHGVGIGGIGVGLMDDALIPLGAAMVAGYVGHKFYEGAKDYQDATMRFKALGLGDAVNEEADKFARATQAYGVSQTELMSAMAESAGLFNSFDEVKRFTPQVVTLGKANAAIYGSKVGELDDEGLKSLMKFIDRRGGTKDDASFARNLDLAEKLVTGSGGFLKFQDLGNFSQQGGTAFRSLSDEGLQHMEGLMIEQGGSKAAVAMMSIYQNLVAGRTPKKTMGLLQDLGLATLQMQTHGEINGKPMKSLIMSDIKDSALLQSDPARWMNDVLLPALAKKGITSQAAILKAVNDVLSNRNASNQASIMTTQQFQLVRDYKLAKGAMGADQVTNMYKGSAGGAEDDFTAAWTDFKNQFGKTMLPAITNMLKEGADILRTIAAASNTAPVQTASNATSSVLHAFAWPYRAISSMFGGGDKGHASTSVAGGSGGASGPVHTTINLDGRKIATAVSPYFAGPLGSGMYIGGVDNNVSLPMPALK